MFTWFWILMDEIDDHVLGHRFLKQGLCLWIANHYPDGRKFSAEK